MPPINIIYPSHDYLFGILNYSNISYTYNTTLLINITNSSTLNKGDGEEGTIIFFIILGCFLCIPTIYLCICLFQGIYECLSLLIKQLGKYFNKLGILFIRLVFSINDNVSTNDNGSTNDNDIKIMLPDNTYNYLQIKDIKEQICSICLDNFEISDKIYCLVCNHVFHKQCIEGWINYKKQNILCPLCKKEITTIYKLNSIKLFMNEL